MFSLSLPLSLSIEIFIYYIFVHTKEWIHVLLFFITDINLSSFRSIKSQPCHALPCIIGKYIYTKYIAMAITRLGWHVQSHLEMKCFELFSFNSCRCMRYLFYVFNMWLIKSKHYWSPGKRCRNVDYAYI